MDILLLIKYIVLGMIQGFTEPLPISSSGHLVIFSELFGVSIDDLNFEIIVNAGSLVAIVFIFRKDIFNIIVNSFKYLFKKQKDFKRDFDYALMIIIGVIPAGLFGFIFKDFIETSLKNLAVVGLSLIVTAIALNLVNKQAIDNSNEDITFKDALVIGVFQIFALIPGISRSGSTMVGGLSRKIKFEDTMRFSFMLYIPISVASMALGIFDIANNGTDDIYITGYIFAFIASIITTYFAVKWFFKVVRQGNLKYFAMYCLVVGFATLILNFAMEVL
ncbi:MAG: undecaprenyl-diphosphate phosphatase [Candidatus Izemoplasma sp.]